MNLCFLVYDDFIFIFSRSFGNYDVVIPGYVSEMRSVPNYITSPPYYKTGIPPESPKSIEIKTNEQIRKMKPACRLARHILDEIGDKIKAGNLY